MRIHFVAHYLEYIKRKNSKTNYSYRQNFHFPLLNKSQYVEKSFIDKLKLKMAIYSYTFVSQFNYVYAYKSHKVLSKDVIVSF